MSIAAGVVCVTEFCSADSSAFSGYINYIDRDEAVRIDNAEKYDLFADYQNYMDDNEKTTGLFTKNESILDKNEKSVLKNMFKKAQENGSMMWQTIFSFDNRWLDMVGIYDPEEDMLDQERLKTVIRSAVGKMLEKEDLTNAVWSAAIHHNTDNYHVHVAITEPVPARAKKNMFSLKKKK